MRVVPDVSFTFRTTLRKFGTFSLNTASHHRRFKSYKHTHKRARAVYKYNASNVGLRPWGRSHEQPQISAHCKGVVQPLTGSIYEPMWILKHRCKSVCKRRPLSRYWDSRLIFGSKPDHCNHLRRGTFSLTRGWVSSLTVCWSFSATY